MPQILAATTFITKKTTGFLGLWRISSSPQQRHIGSLLLILSEEGRVFLLRALRHQQWQHQKSQPAFPWDGVDLKAKITAAGNIFTTKPLTSLHGHAMRWIVFVLR